MFLYLSLPRNNLSTAPACQTSISEEQSSSLLADLNLQFNAQHSQAGSPFPTNIIPAKLCNRQSSLNSSHCAKLNDIVEFLKNGRYPEIMTGNRGMKANFRRILRNYFMNNGCLIYRNNKKGGSDTGMYNFVV